MTGKAEAILERAEAVAGELGLFAEEVDARAGDFLGNHPLLYSQVEYFRAAVETGKAKPLDMARMAPGIVERKISQGQNM